MKRLLSALCLLPLLAVLVRFGSPFHFLLLITGVIGLGLTEFYRMLDDQGLPCWKGLGVVLGVLLPLAAYEGGMASQALITGMIALLFVAGLFAREDVSLSLARAAYTLLGVLYVSWLLTHVLLLRLLQEDIKGQFYVLYVFLVVWLGDAAALYVGSLMGRHRLAPSISPRKTIEGAIGGLLGSVAGALNKMPSTLSRMPPCPGMSRPESLTPVLRLSRDSLKSPS